MERITRGMLESKVDYLKTLNVHVVLDHHQPGGNKYTWAIETPTGRRVWSGRLTARECLICLVGMIEGIEIRVQERQFK